MSVVTKPVVNLGPVRVTEDRNFLRLLLAVLFLLVIAVGTGYAYQEGYIRLINTLQTVYFTAAFAALLIYGVWRGLKECWYYSDSINAIKRAKLSTDELKVLLQVSDLSERSIDLVKEELADDADDRIEVVENISGLASNVGIFGTVLGMMLAIFVISTNVRNVEDLMANLPTITHFLSVAFCTTLVGIIVSNIVLQYARMVRRSATMFKHRVARTLHEYVHLRADTAREE